MGGLFQKKSKQETKGVLLLRTYRFSRDIKERTCGNSRSKLKKKWNVQGVFTKNLWNFYGCWFLTSWNFHQRLSHNSAEFAGVKAYMFSKGKVTNLKFPRVFIRKVYISSPPPTPVWRFSGIAQYSCLTCPPPGYQDQAYLAWFKARCTLDCHWPGKSANWATSPILVNFTN